MRPINKYLIIKKIQEEVHTSSGLLLSAEDTAALRYSKASVIAPGTEVSEIKKGDTIYYDNRAGHSMIIEEETVTIILERDVVVVL